MRLIGSASSKHFYDSPAALSQKFGIEIDAGWSVLGQLNVPNTASASSPIPTGNKMEDAFEQIALLMNDAFRIANAQKKEISFVCRQPHLPCHRQLYLNQLSCA